MALRTLKASVATLQRVRRGRVFLDREFRRLPALHRVTGRALSLIGALGKLALVRVRFMAVHALGKDQRFLEIAARVALSAIDTRVLSFQRELRFRVIEMLVHRLQRNLLPASRVVT